MKKIETWEDLEEALRDNPYGVYFGYTADYGECLIIKKDVLAFNKDGDLIIHHYDDEYGEWWGNSDLKRKTYQQIYDIIKLMLE